MNTDTTTMEVTMKKSYTKSEKGLVKSFEELEAAAIAFLDNVTDVDPEEAQGLPGGSFAALANIAGVGVAALRESLRNPVGSGPDEDEGWKILLAMITGTLRVSRSYFEPLGVNGQQELLAYLQTQDIKGVSYMGPPRTIQ